MLPDNDKLLIIGGGESSFETVNVGLNISCSLKGQMAESLSNPGKHLAGLLHLDEGWVAIDIDIVN